VSPASLKSVSRKISTDRAYKRKMLTSYKFAKAEFAKSGFDLTPRLYSQIKSSYLILQDAGKKIKPTSKKPDYGITVGVTFERAASSQV
jgi:hypothetical protein